MQSIFCGDPEEIARVYPKTCIGTLAAEAGLRRDVVTGEEARHGSFPDVECLFSTWGMPELTADEIRRAFPSLRAVFYGAGSVRHFAAPFLESGVRVFSAWQANAVPVAEYAVSQILLANKGYFQAQRLCSAGNRVEALAAARTFPGNFDCSVGIIAAGQIGRLVLNALRGRELNLFVCDPYLPDEEAAALGAQKCDLPTLFSTCQTVSNHLPNLPETQGILTYDLFRRMKANGIFINTGRGAQVDEAGLARAMAEEAGRCALLDVTWPEVPAADHPFRRLPNVLLTPHMAGSMGNEVQRMAFCMLEAFRQYRAGRSIPCEVTPAMLKTMA